MRRRASAHGRDAVPRRPRPVEAAFLVFNADFPSQKIGAFDTELVREWFQAFAMNAGVTLHAQTLYGDNSHHIAESLFKVVARAASRRSRRTLARRAAFPPRRVRSDWFSGGGDTLQRQRRMNACTP